MSNLALFLNVLTNSPHTALYLAILLDMTSSMFICDIQETESVKPAQGAYFMNYFCLIPQWVIPSVLLADIVPSYFVITLSLIHI